jgi:hypothetical protein
VRRVSLFAPVVSKVGVRGRAKIVEESIDIVDRESANAVNSPHRGVELLEQVPEESIWNRDAATVEMDVIPRIEMSPMASEQDSETSPRIGPPTVQLRRRLLEFGLKARKRGMIHGSQFKYLVCVGGSFLGKPIT